MIRGGTAKHRMKKAALVDKACDQFPLLRPPPGKLCAGGPVVKWMDGQSGVWYTGGTLMRCPARLSCTVVAAIAGMIACLRPAYVGAQGAGTTTTSPTKTQSTAAAGNSPSYAEESIVLDSTESVYTYAADGTGTLERSVAARVQSDAAVKALGVVSVAYAANSQKVEFEYARVRHPDGTVAETPVTDALDMPAPVTREAPFYSDLKEKQLPIRSLRVGDRLEWRAKVTTTKSEAPGQFWGQESFVDDTVALAEVVELRVPAGIAVTVWSPTIKAVETDAGGMHVWRWTASQLKPMAGKEAEAAAEATKKMVWTAEQELDADQGNLPAIAWTTFKSWQEVGAWYAGLEADRVTPGPEVKAKVAELTAGKTTNEDKVRALYAYVSTQVRYIGVAFGIGRYQPHAAAEILSNQYGDCKDKHTLLAAMLAAAFQSKACRRWSGAGCAPSRGSPAQYGNDRAPYVAVRRRFQPIWFRRASPESSSRYSRYSPRATEHPGRAHPDRWRSDAILPPRCDDRDPP